MGFYEGELIRRVDPEHFARALGPRPIGTHPEEIARGLRCAVAVAAPREGLHPQVDRLDRQAPRGKSVLVAVGCRTSEAGAFEVHLVDVLLESVIGLRDARRGEGVGGDDVGAGLEVFAMHLRDELRLRQAEDVAVVAQRFGVIAEPLAAELLVGETFVLQHHAHRAVEDHDPLLKKLIETVANRCRQAHGDQ